MSDFQPTTEVTIISWKTYGVKRYHGAKITEKGSLHIYGMDYDELAQESYGRDLEYDALINPEFKDSVLLLLIKERFRDYQEFVGWLKAQGIPYKESHW